MQTNNVTRLLDARKVTYTLFELPPEKYGAEETARLLDVDPAIVFKTIVITRDKPKKPILAVIPGDREVDLKALASFLKEKRVHLPTQKEAEVLTGLLAGGISPLALINKGFITLLDVSAQKYELIHVSGGQRGMNVRLPVSDLIGLTHAMVAPVSL